MNTNELIDSLKNQSYILVTWPESQEFIGNKKAIFCGGSEEKTGSSAYFVPITIYAKKLTKNNKI